MATAIVGLQAHMAIPSKRMLGGDYNRELSAVTAIRIDTWPLHMSRCQPHLFGIP